MISFASTYHQKKRYPQKIWNNYHPQCIPKFRTCLKKKFSPHNLCANLPTSEAIFVQCPPGFSVDPYNKSIMQPVKSLKYFIVPRTLQILIHMADSIWGITNPPRPLCAKNRPWNRVNFSNSPPQKIKIPLGTFKHSR